MTDFRQRSRKRRAAEDTPLVLPSSASSTACGMQQNRHNVNHQQRCHSRQQGRGAEIRCSDWSLGMSFSFASLREALN
jgi:hypothetical protein